MEWVFFEMDRKWWVFVTGKCPRIGFFFFHFFFCSPFLSAVAYDRLFLFLFFSSYECRCFIKKKHKLRNDRVRILPRKLIWACDDWSPISRGSHFVKACLTFFKSWTTYPLLMDMQLPRRHLSYFWQNFGMLISKFDVTDRLSISSRIIGACGPSSARITVDMVITVNWTYGSTT